MTAEEYRTERSKRGTQASVAALLGVNRVTVAKREAGMQIITREAWLALLSLPHSKPATKYSDGAARIQS